MQIQRRTSIRSAVRPWRLAPLWLGLCLGAGCETGPSRAGPSGVAPDRPDGGAPVPDAPPDAGACASHVDTTSDPDNCGSCGHSCGGGACVASTCRPVALAVGQANPHALAVDATSVYWTTADGQVLAAPIAGGRTTVLASGQRSPWGIAVDADRVYWVNAVASGQVMAVSLAGGTPAVLADLQ
ncbi:MAG TPA: hypothetical protein VK607_04385, partial [Kofleriaceae bacterium]|nr:hypothetical protein [Kofleriaceae bacterium]